jgi:hypothetical protein
LSWRENRGHCYTVAFWEYLGRKFKSKKISPDRVWFTRERKWWIQRLLGIKLYTSPSMTCLLYKLGLLEVSLCTQSSLEYNTFDI